MLSPGATKVDRTEAEPPALSRTSYRTIVWFALAPNATWDGPISKFDNGNIGNMHHIATWATSVVGCGVEGRVRATPTVRNVESISIRGAPCQSERETP